MNAILDDIDRALKAELYYVAIAAALALPDICGAMEATNGRATGDRYKKWWRERLGKIYPQLTDDDIYSLRCGVVHAGSFGHGNMQYDRIIFQIPTPGIHVHSTLFKNCAGTTSTVFVLNPIDFCNDIVAATATWYIEKEDDPTVKKNLPRIVQTRLDGYIPCFNGIPVIA